MSDTTMAIRTDLRPGDIGTVTTLHGTLYAVEHGFDFRFEAYVASSLGEYGQSLESNRSRLWIVEFEQQLTGSVGIVDRGESAQLRWFIVHPSARGQGVGSRLLAECIHYCRAARFSSIYLWTVSPLHDAARLYLKAGFTLSEALPESEPWGVLLNEQRYDLTL